ncbi:MAG: hypothetical protein N2319_04390 [Candidatus Kapabacteria bacterium]|nr:hypothetical protein [Candidatus Kapabacteria bacterium]
MTFEEFKSTLNQENPPAGISKELVALWFEAQGNWDKAHNIVQAMNTKTAAWVHAYLHRKEPNEWNASYWYSIAGRPKPKTTFEEEWEEITRYLLGE